MTTLDNMAFGIAMKEGFEPMQVKNKLTTNVNKLSQKEAEYLVSNMAVLIDKSLNQNESITDKNTQRDFISFLIKLYY